MTAQITAVAEWVEVARFRQRDARIILPLTGLAAAGALLWLPWRFVMAWFVIIVTLQLINLVICRRVQGMAYPTRRHEMSWAGFTFGSTVLYTLLPAAFLRMGDQSAAVAAMAMIAAIALSAASELTASRRISLAALAGAAVMSAAGLLFSPHHGSWLATTVAGIGLIGMFGYVLEAAFHREAAARRLSAALAEARAKSVEAQAANAAKSIFLATMSHEIRTPLNGVLGMAQVMARDPLPQVQQERLEVIRQSGEALTALLNNVLDLSKIEAGQMQLEAIPFDLAEVLASARSAFAPLAAEKGLMLRLDLHPSARGRFEGDPTRLRQVIYNLLSNAVKFTEVGEVGLSAQSDGDLVRIAVADTGPGLSPEAHARLFERFSQLDASTTRRHGGSGLGLAISRQLSRLMKGDLRVESQPGREATFIIELPLRRLPDAASLAPEPRLRAATPESLARLRVLAAEDNPVNQKVLRALLAPLGVEPLVVGDGAQAMEAWSAGAWDIVLMDVRMPVMDGVAATREIRAREVAQALPRTPIIGLSADAMAHQVEELLAAGMDGHVAKPIEVARLYGALEAVT